MTWRREHWREKDQRRSGALGSTEIRNVMSGAGDQGAAKASRPGPKPSPEVNASVQPCRQPDITCHDQHQATRAADPGQLPAEVRPIRLAIMA